MRELKRSIARANMKALGMEKINKKRVVQVNGKAERKSLFGQHWREYVGGEAAQKVRAARRRTLLHRRTRKGEAQ